MYIHFGYNGGIVAVESADGMQHKEKEHTKLNRTQIITVFNFNFLIFSQETCFYIRQFA